MTSEGEHGERTPLLQPNRLSQLQHEHDEEAHSIIASSVTKEEQHLAGSTVGERLPYNDYTTIDWLHDLVHRYFQSVGGGIALLIDVSIGQGLIPLSIHPVASRTAV
jgi:hypothetical protein